MDPAERTRFAGNIQSEATRVQALIDRLLELAAIESRPVLEAREPVDLLSLMQYAIDGLDVTAKSRGIAIGNSFSSGP